MKSGFACTRAPSVNFVDSSLPEGAVKPPSLREVGVLSYEVQHGKKLKKSIDNAVSIV